MPIEPSLLERLSGARFSEERIPRGDAFAGVSTDTRSLKAGELFVALRGERFDGHHFVAEAFQRGAAAAVVEIRWFDHHAISFRGHPLVGVPDPLRALGELARAHRGGFDIPILAIAGSNGKTTTKEMTAAVLAQQWRVLKTESSFNNAIGVPLTLLRLEPGHQAAVLELGTNHPGEIAHLCEIAQPTHGLITNIMREHLEFFESLDGVARAEGELFDWLHQSGGIAFVNADDPLLRTRAARMRQQCRYAFAQADVEVRGFDGGLRPDGRGRLGIACPRRQARFEVEVGLVGRHQIRNALAAATVGLFFGLTTAQIQAALRDLPPAKHRMVLLQTADGVTVLDDAYNANPDSMWAALRTLSELPCRGRRLAALGNMAELGPRAEEYHREIGTAARECKLDGLFTVGELARAIHQAAALPLGRHCNDHEEMIRELKAVLREGDCLLVKASRSMQLERVVDALSQSRLPTVP